ncbi:MULTISPECIES: ATPase, T2SS/T4P/T4SS family [Vibrio]|uniref:ATPase, T2SS/T4P/T4SS family n=1 Tax=Vibrio TaxID=662 RepID=UPI002075D59D|nr:MULTISPECIES: ATPase, T2SS/T4P/T4SS family [Vibrio]USD35498.1 Flp pilus assembly complex ATPase component TadA [Vibrio sp. SCSIO 43186]USD72622.1 Flp pilus assembly complex ATPase component TadA [Vibrio sp. SCSIO 43139]USD99013.1 hypothetical protein CTT30_23355 [Vibrio coralliilyticus]
MSDTTDYNNNDFSVDPVGFTTSKVYIVRNINYDTFEEILQFAVELNLRDVYIKSGDYLRCRQYERRLLMGNQPLTHAQVDAILRPHFPSLDLADSGRGTNPSFAIRSVENANVKQNFRISITKFTDGGEKGYNCAIRPLPVDVPTIEYVELPEEIAQKVGKMKQGLVLLIGATGEGKTSTIAAIMRYVLEKVPFKRVLEFSRPVEFLWQSVKKHPSNQHVPHNVSEDGVSGDMISYSEAISTAMRQAGDWIAIGEMTDAESFEAAIEFSNTGHLVSSSTHGNSISSAYSRIYMKFPQGQREALLDSLISEARMFIAQRLYPRKDREGLVAIREILDHTFEVESRLKEALSSPNPLASLRNEVKACIWEQGTSFYQDAVSKFNQGVISKESLEEIEEMYGRVR